MRGFFVRGIWLATMAGLMTVCCGSLVRADLVVSTFEESGLATNLNANQAYEGLSGVASQFRSGNVTFDNDGVFFGGSTWSGFGYSQRTSVVGPTYYDDSNDLVSKPGSGAGGSATWAVVGSGGVMTADANYKFSTLDLTNTVYTWSSIAQGDPFAGPAFSKGGGTGRFAGADDFFTVRFTDVASSRTLDYNLADFTGSNSFINTDWQTFDVSSLASSQLSIDFLSSRESSFGGIFFMDTPAYAAFDNITVVAVPEPSSLLLAVGAGSFLVRRVWRQRRGNPMGEASAA